MLLKCSILYFEVQVYLSSSVSLHDQSPKMTLNTKSSNVPHIHVYSYPQLPNITRFSLRTPVFDLKAIFRQVRQMAPKRPPTLNDHWPLEKVPHWKKFQKMHIYSYSTPGVEIKLIFALRAAVSEI